MQRVRVGLTGLAFIFLLMLIAAAGMRPSESVAPAEAEGETLAMLGVAPGSGDGGYFQHSTHREPVAPKDTGI
jgi:hypothetical protein